MNSNQTKIAKVQALGSLVRVYDAATPERDLFTLAVSDRLIARIQERAAKRGYSVPQIYPGNDGVVRIWL